MKQTAGRGISGHARAPPIIFRRAMSRGCEVSTPSIVVQPVESHPGDVSASVSTESASRAGDPDDLPVHGDLGRTEVSAVRQAMAPARDDARGTTNLNGCVDSVDSMADCLNWTKGEGGGIDLSEVLAQTSSLVAVAQQRAATCRPVVADGGGSKNPKRKKKARSPGKSSRSISPRKATLSPASSPTFCPSDMDDRANRGGLSNLEMEEDRYGVLSSEHSKWKLLLDKNRAAGSGQVKCAKKTCEQLAFMSVVEVEAAQARSVHGRYVGGPRDE